MERSKGSIDKREMVENKACYLTDFKYCSIAFSIILLIGIIVFFEYSLSSFTSSIGKVVPILSLFFNIITLHKVISKDSNICYICGQPCDEHDMVINEDGHYIAGNSYPSIDHVIPIAQGGTHSWDNVRLAHRGCNSKKGAKSMYKINQGQVMFSL